MGAEIDDDDETPLDLVDGGSGNRVPPGVTFRLSQLTTQKRELKREVGGARARIAELEGELAKREEAIKGFDPVRQELDALKKREATWAEERALLAAGLTDEDDQAVARALHARIPEKERRPLPDWLGDLKKDPTKAPKQIAHAFTGAKKDDAGGSANGGAGGGAGGGDATGAGGGNADTRGGLRADGQNGAGQPLSAEAIRAIRQRAIETGDFSEWKKVRGAAYGGR